MRNSRYSLLFYNKFDRNVGTFPQFKMATFIKISKSDLLEMPNSERDKVDFFACRDTSKFSTS